MTFHHDYTCLLFKNETKPWNQELKNDFEDMLLKTQLRKSFLGLPQVFLKIHHILFRHTSKSQFRRQDFGEDFASPKTDLTPFLARESYFLNNFLRAQPLSPDLSFYEN